MVVPVALTAVLVVGSWVDERGDAPLGSACPLHLTPLLGKNPLIYAVETLVASGIQRIICLGWDDPVGSQSELGNGRRWGCDVEWHTLSGPHQAFERLVDVAPPLDAFLLANTSCLMQVPLQPVQPQIGTLFVPQPYIQDRSTVTSQPPQDWGWAWVERAQCAVLARGARWPEWGAALRKVCLYEQAVAALDLADGGALLRAIAPMLTHQFPVVMDGSEIEPGIFVSRNVVIHPTATIRAPLYLGADVVLGSNCRVGPHAAIGPLSHVGPDCDIAQAQLGPGSWLGASLDVKHALVWRGLIWSERLKARMPIVDAGLLSQPSQHWTWRRILTRLSERLLASLLCLLFLPVLIALGLLHRAGCWVPNRIHLVDPARARLSDPTRPYCSWLGAKATTRNWRHAAGFVLPNLWGVVLGRWCLVGLRPRTPSQWSLLPPDHQHWLSEHACGLIQEEWLLSGAEADPLQSMALDGFQVMRSHSLLYPWGLMGRYGLMLLQAPQRSEFQPKEGKPQWK